MKKLSILSTSFVSLMSSTNFFFLRLDRFTQLLNTFSVVLGLEFVFSNLCLAIRENLLSLSLQECPNMFAFRVVSLSFLAARYKWANNGSFRSIMTDWRRQTRRQAFCFRVIGSSSARVKERLADGDVIVVEVFREPLLARGLLGAFDKPLRWSGRWAHHLWEAPSRPEGAKVLSGSTQGTYPPHRGNWKWRAVGTAGCSERWWGRKRSEWMCRERSRTTLTTRWHMRVRCGDECEPELLSSLEPKQCAYIWTKKKQSRDDDTNNKDKRLQKQTSQAVLNPQRSRVTGCTREFPHASVHSTCFCACRSFWRILLLSMNQTYSLSDQHGNFPKEIHTAKVDLWGVLYTSQTI